MRQRSRGTASVHRSGACPQIQSSTRLICWIPSADYLLIGGSAAILHGAADVTQGVDFCCSRESNNVERIARALKTVHPCFRVLGLPEGVPTRRDVRTLRNGDSFAFITDIGFVDSRFSVDGIGSFSAVRAMSSVEDFGKRRFRMLSFDGLIQCKTAIARPRDLALVPELEMMREAELIRQRMIAQARAADDLDVEPD